MKHRSIQLLVSAALLAFSYSASKATDWQFDTTANVNADHLPPAFDLRGVHIADPARTFAFYPHQNSQNSQSGLIPRVTYAIPLNPAADHGTKYTIASAERQGSVDIITPLIGKANNSLREALNIRNEFRKSTSFPTTMRDGILSMKVGPEINVIVTDDKSVAHRIIISFDQANDYIQKIFGDLLDEPGCIRRPFFMDISVDGKIRKIIILLPRENHKAKDIAGYLDSRDCETLYHKSITPMLADPGGYSTMLPSKKMLYFSDVGGIFALPIRELIPGNIKMQKHIFDAQLAFKKLKETRAQIAADPKWGTRCADHEVDCVQTAVDNALLELTH